MTNYERAIEAWRRVRQEFFPVWDRKREWKLCICGYLLAGGKCYPDRKLITLQRVPNEQDKLETLLIHEICHAFSPAHEGLWQSRFSKVAVHADEIGRRSLGTMIRDEVSRYACSPHTTQYYYQEYIEDFFMDRPDGKFEEMMRSLAFEVGLSLKDAKSYFPRARRDFDREQRRSRLTWPEYRTHQAHMPGLSAQTDESGQFVAVAKEIDENR
jgi:hypothetical protein